MIISPRTRDVVTYRLVLDVDPTPGVLRWWIDGVEVELTATGDATQSGGNWTREYQLLIAGEDADTQPDDVVLGRGMHIVEPVLVLPDGVEVTFPAERIVICTP